MSKLIPVDPLSLINRVQILSGGLREAIEAMEVLANKKKYDAFPSEQSRADYAKDKIENAKAALRG